MSNDSKNGLLSKLGKNIRAASLATIVGLTSGCQSIPAGKVEAIDDFSGKRMLIPIPIGPLIIPIPVGKYEKEDHLYAVRVKDNGHTAVFYVNEIEVEQIKKGDWYDSRNNSVNGTPLKTSEDSETDKNNHGGY